MKKGNIQTDKNEIGTWDFSPIFDGDNDTKIGKRRILDKEKSESFIVKWKDRSDYLTDTSVLKEALDEYELWMRNTGTYDAENYYFGLRSEQDLGNPSLKAASNKIRELSTKLYNDIQFFSLRIAKVSKSKQSEFLKDPKLKEYKHFLELLFNEAKYHLTESEEKIINLKRQVGYDNWTKMVNSFLCEEEREVLTEKGNTQMKNFSDLWPLLFSQKKEVRDSAAIAINDILMKHAPVAEHEMNSIMANKKIDDELRSLPRPDSVRHISDDTETEVVDLLLKSVSGKFSISKRWYKLKAKLLGLPKLDYHERIVEYGLINEKYSFEDSCKIVSSVFTKLDPEFGSIFDGFVTNRRIDVNPKKGKQGGAFCASGSLSLPTYILLNHTSKFNDVSTLAHEAGHGINDELMKANLNALNFGSPLSTAEVASTFMEDFVLSEMVSEVNEETKLTILVRKMDDDVGTIFRQVACYLFETELHTEFRKKGYLSKEEIGKLFQKHMSAYMGDGVTQSEGSENWWVYWSHIRNFFYVYSYANGLLISKTLQRMVRKDSKSILKVKKFLSAGSSESPKDIFAKLEIDITSEKFWNTGLQEIEDRLEETEKLAKKLGKI